MRGLGYIVAGGLIAAALATVLIVGEPNQPRAAEPEPASPAPAQELPALQPLPAWLENTHCIDGRLLRKLPNGWESVIHEGRALTCEKR